MTVTIKIKCDNAAFEEPCAGTELGDILAKIARDVDGENDQWLKSVFHGHTIMDHNGNLVGSVTVSE